MNLSWAPDQFFKPNREKNQYEKRILCSEFLDMNNIFTIHRQNLSKVNIWVSYIFLHFQWRTIFYTNRSHNIRFTYFVQYYSRRTMFLQLVLKNFKNTLQYHTFQFLVKNGTWYGLKNTLVSLVKNCIFAPKFLYKIKHRMFAKTPYLLLKYGCFHPQC